MDFKQKEKRKRIMKRSIALGHCVCDPRKPCPCPRFKEYDVCECAGERMPAVNMAVEDIKLTAYVKSAGCASKIGKKELRAVLNQLPAIDDKRVVVGSSAGDDAGVIVLEEDEETALILTVDVFAPSVDSPYTFGEVAAANSVSDIYAMGGTPLAALSIIGFPIRQLPEKVMAEILRGGIDKMKEAGISVVGGHSINDEEIKCGFAVLGRCPRSALKRNSGAQAGDKIILTKPIGGGIVAFASQIGNAPQAALSELHQAMTTLNKDAARLQQRYQVHAMTDITGYSLIGHMIEILKNSRVSAVLDFDTIPLFPDVSTLADQDVLPGAIERNQEAVDNNLLDFSSLSEGQKAILFSPETSGGLLMLVAPDDAPALVEELKQAGHQHSSIIGHIKTDHPTGFLKVTTCTPQTASCCGESAPMTSDTATCGSGDTPAETSCCGSGDQPAPPAAEQSCCSQSTSGGTHFQSYLSSVVSAGEINLKHKKLMALSLSVVTKCKPCVKLNVAAARKAGATSVEINEAIEMGIAFGGASVYMFYSSIKNQLNET